MLTRTSTQQLNVKIRMQMLALPAQLHPADTAGPIRSNIEGLLC